MKTDPVNQFTQAQREELIRYYAAGTEDVRKKIHKKQSKLINVHRQDWKGRMPIHEIAYHMFLQAIHQYRKDATAGARKGAINEKAAKRIEEADLDWVHARKKPREGKCERVVRENWEQIRRWRTHPTRPCSWQDLTLLIKRKFQVSMSRAHLRLLYTKFEQAEAYRAERFYQDKEPAE
jgi:hypothetical protein